MDESRKVTSLNQVLVNSILAGDVDLLNFNVPLPDDLIEWMVCPRCQTRQPKSEEFKEAGDCPQFGYSAGVLPFRLYLYAGEEHLPRGYLKGYIDMVDYHHADDCYGDYADPTLVSVGAMDLGYCSPFALSGKYHARLENPTQCERPFLLIRGERPGTFWDLPEWITPWT